MHELTLHYEKTTRCSQRNDIKTQQLEHCTDCKAQYILVDAAAAEFVISLNSYL